MIVERKRINVVENQRGQWRMDNSETVNRTVGARYRTKINKPQHR